MSRIDAEAARFAQDLALDTSREITVGLVDRGMRVEVAQGYSVIAMFGAAIAMAHHHHGEGLPKMSREELHKQLDSIWDALEE